MTEKRKIDPISLALRKLGGFATFETLRAAVAQEDVDVSEHVNLLREAGLLRILNDGYGHLFYVSEDFLERRRK